MKPARHALHTVALRKPHLRPPDSVTGAVNDCNSYASVVTFARVWVWCAREWVSMLLGDVEGVFPASTVPHSCAAAYHAHRVC